MRLLQKIISSNFFIKLRSWEYWPFGVVQFPLFIYFAWLAFRARSLTFFSASNPGIVMGGMFGESKFDILSKVPPQYLPRTFIIRHPSSLEDVRNELLRHHLEFPLIFKPDLGERGFMVKRINNEEDVADYIKKIRQDFLIQELVDLPLEFGVFYTRFPAQDRGSVTSVVMKEMLSVTGDGKSSLRDLIIKNERAKLQWTKLKDTFKERVDDIIPEGQKVEIVSIGNHCLGTKFMDGSHLINDRLSSAFDQISRQVPGFYFGRYDLRCGSIEDLYTGNIKVMELNGCGAEPAHIYHPGFSLVRALRILFTHWRHIYLIARENASRGVSYTPMREAYRHYRKFKAATTA